MTVLYLLVAVGTMLSGIAAFGQFITRFHVQQLRKEVNGQSATLVATAHKLGVSEGVIAAQSDAFERGDTRGAP